MAGDARLRASSARRARDLATHGTVRALAVAHEEGIAALLALDEAGRFSAEERSAVWPLLHTLTLAVVGATRDLEDLARQVAEEAYR